MTVKFVLSALFGIPLFFHQSYFHLFTSLVTGHEYLTHDDTEMVKQVAQIETVRKCIVRRFVRSECEELQIALMPKEITALIVQFVGDSVVPHQVHLEEDLCHQQVYRHGVRDHY